MIHTSSTHSTSTFVSRTLRQYADTIFKYITLIAGLIILFILTAVTIFLLIQAAPVMVGDKNQTVQAIRSLSGGRTTHFWTYVGPLIFGTILTSFLALVCALFIALGVALFITQYAPRPLAFILNHVIDLLVAVPSVIFGLWGGLVLVPSTYPFWKWINTYFGWIPLFSGQASNPPRTVATVSLVLTIMILPIICSMARDIFQQTPVLLKEAALGLGATRWEMIKLAVLPFGKKGVISAAMLGLGRALGETMAVLMILSPGDLYSWKLLVASQNQTIAANIAAQFPESDSAGVSVLIATGLVLFVITFLVNIAAHHLTGNAIHTKRKKQHKTPTVHQQTIHTMQRNGLITSPIRSLRSRQYHDHAMTILIYSTACLALLPLMAILWSTISHGSTRFDWYFLTHNMKGVVGGLYPYGGVLNAILGTLLITITATLISVPIGLFAAIYMVEYAHGGVISTMISFLVDVMSGIPSIVAGLFAYALFSLFFGPGCINGFVGAVALSVLMIPTVVRSCEQMLDIVPQELREASYALGATKSRTIINIVLRSSLPGIISGVLLAIARVIGETAPLLIASGSISSTNLNLFNGRMSSLPVYVYNQYAEGMAVCSASARAAMHPCIPGIRMERAWAAALVLILIVLFLNLIGRFISHRFSVSHR
ncbi:MAG: phosphate ABC transporter permease subunit PstC [Aeriscardovia sp.]|nr:phosphate ABC transporter permease subunit PstC [Aeriscardovia sp.]MBR3359624.1 phosphate ABC transporter permease subunit PstC [Aeriscardovia sp.]